MFDLWYFLINLFSVVNIFYIDSFPRLLPKRPKDMNLYKFEKKVDINISIYNMVESIIVVPLYIPPGSYPMQVKSNFVIHDK